MKVDQKKIPLSLFQDTGPKWYLVRERDNLIKGSSKLRFLEFNEDGTFKDQHDEIKVGYSILLGNTPFSAWQTTEIVEIEEQKEDYYKFKTKNSSYVLYKEKKKLEKESN